MRNSGSSGLWPFLALVAVGSTVLSMMASNEVVGSIRACCFDNADCAFLNRSTCEDVEGGVSQEPGTNCSTVTCPLLCSGSDAPTCGGNCSEPGQTCQPGNLNGSDGGGEAVGDECQCLFGACCFGGLGGDTWPGCDQQLNQSACEGQGGMYMGDGTNCSACQSLCGFSGGPACGGSCPDGYRCEFMEPYMASGEGGGAEDCVTSCACQPITGACCADDPATGQCINDKGNAAYCDKFGGTYQGDDTNCSTVQCPRDCGYTTAPECNGACPEGQTCFQLPDPNAQGGGAGGNSSPLDECDCFIPPGGGCVEEPNLCLPGFSCDPASGVCCNRPCDGEGESCDDTGICRVVAPAPAVSHRGLVIFLSLLIAAGVLGLRRRRSA